MQHRSIRRGISLLFFFSVVAMVQADDWPAWRGPATDGHTKETDLPTKWDPKSVVWRTQLPGEGQSSPVIWGDRIFLTTALDKGKDRVVLCIDRAKGTIIWQHKVWTGSPEGIHKMNGWATPTCATDGEHVIAFFGRGGLHCFTVDGKKLWSRDLGEFPGSWGAGACPILFGDLVIQNCDAMGKSSLLAVDRKTGKDVWQTPRQTPPKGGWSTPVLIESNKRKELVLNGEPYVFSYDPATGKELWRCKAFAGRGEPTVAPGIDKVFIINGLPGDIYSVKLGGNGDVTKTHIAWHTGRKGGRDQPSPIVVGKYLVTADMGGIATCYDAASGKQLWRDRLRSTFTSSPIAVNGLVYFLGEDGITSVIEPADTFKLVGEYSVGAEKSEIFRASPAPAHGQIFVRSQTHLYCIGK